MALTLMQTAALEARVARAEDEAAGYVARELTEKVMRAVLESAREKKGFGQQTVRVYYAIGRIFL